MVNGRRYKVSTRCHTSTAAHKQLERFEADPENYTPAGARGPSLELTVDLAAGFLAWSRDQKHNTPRWVRDQKRYLVWWAEQLAGTDLRRVRAAQLVDLLEGTAARSTKIRVLKSFYGWLRKERFMITPGEDPTLGTIAPPQGRPAQWERTKAFSAATYAAVRAHLADPYLAAADVLAGTGWHYEELERFARAGSITTHPVNGAPVLESPLAKSGEPARAEVSPDVAAAAERLQAAEAFNYWALRDALRKACKAAGVKPAIAPGHFRHAVATHAVNAGAAQKDVSTFLAHKSERTTKRFYATHGVPAKVPTLR